MVCGWVWSWMNRPVKGMDRLFFVHCAIVGWLMGRVDGKRYFQCGAKHAVFVRPDKVTVGDFPEEDLFGSDDEEI